MTSVTDGQSPLDAAPPDGFARAFRVPPQIAADEELAALYDNIIASLRREALGLPMNTVQIITLERIASQYVLMKWREENGMFAKAEDNRAANAQWLAATAEFNKQLQANRDQMRDALLASIQKIVVETIDLVEDPEVRRLLKRTASERFAELGE